MAEKGKQDDVGTVVNRDLFSKIVHLLVRDGYLSTKIVIFGKNQAIYFIRVVCFLMIFLNMFSKLENKALEKSTPTSLTKAHPSLTKR